MWLIETKTLEELIEANRTAPSFDLYRELTYRCIGLAEDMVNAKNALTAAKEAYKTDEAQRSLTYKQWGTKMTVIEIESSVRLDLSEQKDEILEFETNYDKLYAKFDALKLFLKAVDWTLFYLNSKKNDVA